MKTKIMIFSLLVLTVKPAMASQSSCEIFADKMTKQVVDIFHDNVLSESQKRQDLNMTFKEAVDTDWIGKFVLGRFWKAATPEEQKDYLQAYREYLTNIYVSKFNDEDSLALESIKLASFKPNQNGGFEAKTLIEQKGEDDVHVDYVLDDSSDKCQVHDIKVEGVSLLTSQRSEISSIAAKSGVKGVITILKQHMS